MSSASREPSERLYGSLDLLILQTLAWEPMHGYGIASFISQRTAGVFVIVDAALYKCLHRLERQGLVRGEWGVTEENRRAKFYHLTATGRVAMRAEATAWNEYVVAVRRVMKPV